MKLASILNKELVLCGLGGSNREEIYKLMLNRAISLLELPFDWEKVLVDIIEREDSIGIQYEGMAIPHVRVRESKDLYIIVGILEKPVQIKPDDIKPTSIVIMSLISDNTSDTYLKSLSAFTRYLSKPQNLNKITTATTGEQFLNILTQDDVKLKRDITADDVMMREWPSVKAEDRLSHALDILNREVKTVLAVVDNDNRLIGELDATQVIKSFIPDYILMMDNLKFLSSFEIFEKIFKEEETRYVRDYMKIPAATVGPETPLVQFTVTLAKGQAKTVFVIDKEQKLLGIISIRSIIHKILRG